MPPNAPSSGVKTNAQSSPSTEDSNRNLECGTSLAETEHIMLGSDASATPALTDTQSTNALDSIESLQNEIASDKLTSDGGVLETFTSPFEVPIAMRTSTTDRFLTVPMVYCDHTASNRPVQSIERYIESVCLPLYGNTHTNTSITGSQSTAFVAEARQIVAEATNAKVTGKASLDVVLFAGNGCTSAVELLIDCLGLQSTPTENSQRPVVFVGPHEHHSNLLPWRESGCEIVMVPESPSSGSVDIDALDQLLSHPQYASRLKMGTFTAASNVTGAVSNVDEIAATLHRHGSLAFFDYATGAPYLPMNMNPPPSEQYPSVSMTCKDAIFLSPHKMLGGVGTPGVLIVKKHLVNQVNAPSRSGGGTVFYVTNKHHRFLSNRIERYEGGTPNVTGIVRTGLTFLLKRKLEQQYALIHDGANDNSVPKSLVEFDYNTYDRIIQRLKRTSPNLVMLGCNSGGRHLPIFSFLVRCGRRFLHYNYVCAILNDVFGIQSRGGCQCAGPYSQRLLGLTERDSNGNDVSNRRNEEIEHALMRFKERAELLRPGFTRLSLPFKGLREDETEYVVSAMEWVAKNAWSLMCQYTCNHRTGEWRHQSRQGKPLGRNERRWLSRYNCLQALPRKPSSSTLSGTSAVASMQKEALVTADSLLVAARADRPSIAQALKMSAAEATLGGLDDSMEHLRWYIYPKECAVWITEGLSHPPDTESLEILGCLRPGAVEIRKARQTVLPEILDPMVVSSPDALADSRKRKLFPTGGSLSNGDVIDTTEQTISESSFAFRDGEHTGEASLNEIEAGYEDGELSHSCQVFDSTCDSWVPVNLFLSGAQIKPAVSTAHEEGDEVVRDAVDDRKKPFRDSSAWGQASVPEPPTKPKPPLEFSSTTAVCPGKKNRKGRGIRPPPKMMRYITQAIFQWNMIEEGDRLLLGLSGGKDSLSLLHCLLELKRKLPINFDIEVCTIDPLTPSFDPSPLIPYVESIGLKYHYIRDDIVDRASKSGKNGETVSSLCAYCARMKRGNLYTCARRNNCNKLVLAQHLDDLAESFLMSTFHNGFVRTMKANYRINSGDLSVIRPMVYCRESLMTEFAKASNLPVINENCPACFEEPKERARVKKLLSREETLYPNIYDNIRRSLIPLMHDDSTAILRSYLEEALEKSKKENQMKCKNEVWRRKLQDKAIDDGLESTTGGARNVTEVEQTSKRAKLTLSNASEEELVTELARRRAEKFRLAGAMKRLGNDEDPTGQVCTLKGGDGSIPCHELME